MCTMLGGFFAAERFHHSSPLQQGLRRGNSKVNFPTVPPSPSAKSDVPIAKAGAWKVEKMKVFWDTSASNHLIFTKILVAKTILLGNCHVGIFSKQESELTLPAAPSLPPPPRCGEIRCRWGLCRGPDLDFFFHFSC